MAHLNVMGEKGNDENLAFILEEIRTLHFTPLFIKMLINYILY